MNKRVIIKAILTLTIPFTPLFVFAYEAETTHAGLTQEIVSFYNLSAEKKISDDVKEKIIQGSIDEDYPNARVLNHFYDPVRNVGLSGYRTSKEWASGDVVANEYSWTRGIEAYAKGDTDKAYKILGHMLHLVEDAGVPDHTRNDPHTGIQAGKFQSDSPYEKWVGEHKDRKTVAGLGKELFYSGEKFKNYPTLGEYFDFLAGYSNGNFFSKDTMGDQVGYKYNKPKVEEMDEDYIYGMDSVTKIKIKLLIKKKNPFTKGRFSKVLILDDDYSVLSEYFDRLARQIIPTGAGVIELFFKEGGIAQAEYLKDLEDTKKDEEALAQKKEALAGKNIFAKATYWLQYTWEYDVKRGAWDSVARARENIGMGALALAQNMESGFSVLGFTSNSFARASEEGVAVGAKVLSVETKNSVTFVKKNSVRKDGVNILATGPGNALSKELTDKIKDTLLQSFTPQKVVIENTNPVSPSPLFPISTQSLVLPLTIIPGFGGGAAPLPQSAPPVPAPTSDIIPATSTVTSSLIIPPPADTTAPDITTSLSDCVHSLAVDHCLLGVSTSTLSWSSLSTDIDSFSVIIDGIASATSSLTEVLITLSQGSHLLAVVARDTSGNRATSSEVTVEYFKQPIVISEIGWAGSEISPTHEWLELYNRTPSTLRLDDTNIMDVENNLRIFLSGTIAPGSFYLIERGSNEVIPTITADLISPFDGSELSDAGGQLVLYQTLEGHDVILDKTPKLTLCGGWCEGSPGVYSSMTRINMTGNGGGSANWASDGHYVRPIFDTTGIMIKGSPRGPIENPCLTQSFASKKIGGIPSFSRLALFLPDPCL